jgi:hypothetical protein
MAVRFCLQHDQQHEHQFCQPRGRHEPTGTGDRHFGQCYEYTHAHQRPWTETGITCSNAPALGMQLGSSGTFGAGWTTVDVTSYITGNGTYNFAFSTKPSFEIILVK